MGAAYETVPKPCGAPTCDKGKAGLYTPGGRFLRQLGDSEVPPACLRCKLRELNLVNFQWEDDALEYWRLYCLCSRVNIFGVRELWCWPRGGGAYGQSTKVFQAFKALNEIMYG